MREPYEIIEIEPGDLAKIMIEKRQAGARLVQICAVRIPDGYEVLYSLNLGYQLENYRLTINEETEIVSISEIFPSGALYENEISELFGVKISGLNLNYNHKFYRINQETPFK